MDNKTDPPKNKAMGAKVAKVRGSLSQTAFSELIDTTQGNLSRIENGQIPSADILLRIARFGETTVEELLEGENGTKMEVDLTDKKMVVSGQPKKYTEADMRDAIDGWKGQCAALNKVLDARDKEIQDLKEKMAAMEKRLKDGTDP